MLRLDLGCGHNPEPGYMGVDLLPSAGRQMNLCNGEPWLFEGGSVDELRASHFIEHIPQREIRGQNAFFWFFDEAWRVAKVGALFHLKWPAHDSVWAFQDPTHCRFIPPQTMGYLSRAGREVLRVPQYATCNWELVGHVMAIGNEKDGVLEYSADLRKDL